MHFMSPNGAQPTNCDLQSRIALSTDAGSMPSCLNFPDFTAGAQDVPLCPPVVVWTEGKMPIRQRTDATV